MFTVLLALITSRFYVECIGPTVIERKNKVIFIRFSDSVFICQTHLHKVMFVDCELAASRSVLKGALLKERSQVKVKHAIKLKTSPARFAQLLHNCCSPLIILPFCQWRRTVQSWSLTGLVLCFMSCFTFTCDRSFYSYCWSFRLQYGSAPSKSTPVQDWIHRGRNRRTPRPLNLSCQT